MRIGPFHIPFTKRVATPFIWLNDPDAIKTDAMPSKISFTPDPPSSIGRIIFSIALIIFGLIFVLVPIGVFAVIDPMQDEDSDEPCWPDQDSAKILSDGTVYCHQDNWTEKYSNYQIADGHYRMTMYEEVQEYRWSEENGTITYSWIDGNYNHYDCWQYIRASALPENFTGDDLIVKYGTEDESYPEWCNESNDNSNITYSDTNSIPFDGELLYDKYPDDMAYSIQTTQYKEDGNIHHTYHELDWGDESPLVVVLVLSIFVLAGLGVMMVPLLLRKRILTFDTIANQVTEEFAKWPRFGTLRTKIQMPLSVEIVRNTREVHHSEGGGEHSSARTWTTYHDGIDITVDLVGQGPQPVLFLEGDDARNEYDSILGQLFFVLGLDLSSVEGTIDSDDDEAPFEARLTESKEGLSGIIFIEGDVPYTVGQTIAYTAAWILGIWIISGLGFTFLSPFCGLAALVTILQFRGIMKTLQGESIMVKEGEGMTFRNTKDPTRYDGKMVEMIEGLEQTSSKFEEATTVKMAWMPFENLKMVRLGPIIFGIISLVIFLSITFI
jgi:hypothetical protein